MKAASTEPDAGSVHFLWIPSEDTDRRDEPCDEFTGVAAFVQEVLRGSTRFNIEHEGGAR